MVRVAATEDTSVGEVHVDYAFNSWVHAESRGRAAQKRVRSAADMGDLLIEVGIPMREARELGDRLWSARPKDATLAAARPWEPMWRGTGLPTPIAIGIAFLGPVIIGFFFVALWWLLF